MKGGIYLITNTVNGKRYVGSSCNIRSRIFDHKKMLRGGRHHSTHLQRAWDKYGEDVFTFEAIEPVANDLHLVAVEQTYIDYYKPAYNMSPTASSCRGVKKTPEQCQAMRAARLGTKHTEEHKKKIGDAHRGMKRPESFCEKAKLRRHTDATKQKMSQVQLGKKRSAETKERIRQSKLGTKHTEEWKRQNSERMMGHEVPAESREKMRKAAASRMRPVNQLCLETGAVIASYESVQAASRSAPGLLQPLINKVINGRRKSHAGFGWEYAS